MNTNFSNNKIKDFKLQIKICNLYSAICNKLMMPKEI